MAGLLGKNPLNDPRREYGIIAPYSVQRNLYEDQTSDDAMMGGSAVEWAVPELVRGVGNAAIRMGQTVQGQRPPDAGQTFFDMLDFSPASVVSRVPAGVLSSSVGAVRRQADDTSGKQSMYDVPPGSKPEYRGAAVDRTEFSHVRYVPKNESPRVQASMEALTDPNNPVLRQLIGDIKRGLKINADDWYNTEELRNWFVKELGEERGHREWSEYLNMVGATSPGSKVPANIRNAAAMRNRLYSDEVVPGSNRTVGETYREGLMGVNELPDARKLARGRKKGYGHKTQGLQELILARQLQGRHKGEPEPGVAPSSSGMTENPKPKGFAASLKGSARNIAADLHFTRYMAMASKDKRWLSGQAEVGTDTAAQIMRLGPRKLKPYFNVTDVDGKQKLTFNAKKAAKDGKVSAEDLSKINAPQLWAAKPEKAEYAVFEKFIYDIGQKLNLTGPQVQAALWMGAAKRTGVDVSSQYNFMHAMRNVADERAAKEGLTREQVMRRFIRDKGLLATPGSAGFGLMNKEGDRQRGSMRSSALTEGLMAREKDRQQRRFINSLPSRGII